MHKFPVRKWLAVVVGCRLSVVKTNSIIRLDAKDILSFLGRKLTGNFTGEAGGRCAKRKQGSRVRHWVEKNSIKMYRKTAVCLRVETVINNPRDFKILRQGTRDGVGMVGWFVMSKDVRNLPRYAEISKGTLVPFDR